MLHTYEVIIKGADTTNKDKPRIYIKSTGLIDAMTDLFRYAVKHDYIKAVEEINVGDMKCSFICTPSDKIKGRKVSMMLIPRDK